MVVYEPFFRGGVRMREGLLDIVLSHKTQSKFFNCLACLQPPPPLKKIGTVEGAAVHMPNNYCL